MIKRKRALLIQRLALSIVAAPFAFVPAATAQSYLATLDQSAYTRQDLDQMLAPIALYPDALLVQILMAATFPAEIREAARWSRTYPGVSGDAAILDELISRLSPGGEIVLAGFYDARPSFAFPPAFMREARLRVAAEWKPKDLAAVQGLLANGSLRLDDIVTHVRDAADAPEAYRTAFEDSSCLKMVLDWRTCA